MNKNFCDKCGEKITSQTKFCPNCGNKLHSDVKSGKVKAVDHESYITYSILAVLLPGIGIILGMLYLAKDEPVDKKIGEHMLALGVLSIILWFIAFYIFGANLFRTPAIYSR